MRPNTTADFWPKVERRDADECWRWLAGRSSNGYGSFRLNGHNLLAHRLAYELVVGPIPEGLQIDHLCRNKWCVNPKHLEPVTPKVNSRRANVRTVCRNGHPYTPENTHRWRDLKICIQCRRRASLAWYHRNKAVRA